MNKQKLFLDYDGVLVDSITSFCRTYDLLYYYNEKWKPANPEKVNRWDFKDECPLLDGVSDIEYIFAHQSFFNLLHLFPNARTVIEALEQKYNIYIVTIGTLDNLSLKAKWINQNLFNIDNVILLNNCDCKMDKSIVNMEGGILIDDHEDNLFSSNASRKICFGKKYDWNKNWQGERAADWLEVEKLLL
jgi:5'(3')-deoxyribonucleotidase